MKAKATALFALVAGALTAMNGLAQPVITVQPVNATVEVGLTYNNQVVASSPDPLRFEWYSNGALLDGQTSSNLTIPNIQTTKKSFTAPGGSGNPSITLIKPSTVFSTQINTTWARTCSRS